MRGAESQGGHGLQQVLRCRSLLSSSSVLLALSLPVSPLPFSASSAFVSFASPLFPSTTTPSGCCSSSCLSLFSPLASSMLSNLVLCFISAELRRIFCLSVLCSTAEDHEPSQVKAAHDHVEIQTLCWGKFSFARYLHLLPVYVTAPRPVLCYGNKTFILLRGKAYFSRKL